LSNLTVQEWPGPIRTTASDTKKIPEKFSRPWQAHTLVNPETCLFETRPQAVLEILEQPNKDGWKVLKSTAAPEPYHNLVIPETCRTWPEERLRRLGGAGKIAEAIEIASRRIKDDCLERAQFSVQIGPLAAQNLPHLHYHLYYADELFSEPNLAEMIIAQQGDHLKDLLFLENNSFRIVAGGHRTGQCFLLRQDMEEAPLFNADIAETLSRLINLYARKFKSVEGMPPDFGLELSLRRQIQFVT